MVLVRARREDTDDSVINVSEGHTACQGVLAVVHTPQNGAPSSVEPEGLHTMYAESAGLSGLDKVESLRLSYHGSQGQACP